MICIESNQAFLQRLKQRIRVVKVFLRILSFLLAAYTLTTMSLTLSMFLRTVRIRRTLYIPPEPITRGPWAKNSKIWPTYVLLVTSIISCGSSLIVLALYTHSIKAANKAQLRYSQIAYGLFAAYAAVWIGTAVAYRQGKNGKDMWGWSCEGETQRVLQPFFKDKLDFRLLCDIQVCAVENPWECRISLLALHGIILFPCKLLFSADTNQI